MNHSRLGANPRRNSLSPLSKRARLARVETLEQRRMLSAEAAFMDGVMADRTKRYQIIFFVKRAV